MSSSMAPEDRIPLNGKIRGLRGQFHVLMRNNINDQLLEKTRVGSWHCGLLNSGNVQVEAVSFAS